MRRIRGIRVGARMAANLFVVALLFFGTGIMGRNVAALHGPSEQVVFSGTGTISGGALAGTPFGFWIWCEAESDNPYQGECKGSMYIYALRLTKHVEDAEEPGITELSEGIYLMNVASKDGTIAALLQNAEEPVKGPHNVVNVTFTSPNIGTGTSTNAVVNVTGPPEE